MNVLDLIINSYNSTMHYPQVLQRLKVASVVRHLLVVIVNIGANYFIPKPCCRTISNTTPRIIVSLTSYPARIDKIWMTISTLLNQTLKPDKVVLWLSRKQIDDIKILPKRLIDLMDKGLEIRLVEEDYRSHKKYLYAFKEYLNDYVMLADDDILYASNTIESLYKDMSSGEVHCKYAYKMTYCRDGLIAPYSKWKKITEPYSGEDMFFGSGGGVLIMPSSLPSIVCDIETAITLCPTADDVWLNAMVRKAKLKVVKSSGGDLPFPTNGDNDIPLSAINVAQGQNDEQIARVEAFWPGVFSKILHD